MRCTAGFPAGLVVGEGGQVRKRRQWRKARRNLAAVRDPPGDQGPGVLRGKLGTRRPRPGPAKTRLDRAAEECLLEAREMLVVGVQCARVVRFGLGRERIGRRCPRHGEAGAACRAAVLDSAGGNDEARVELPRGGEAGRRSRRRSSQRAVGREAPNGSGRLYRVRTGPAAPRQRGRPASRASRGARGSLARAEPGKANARLHPLAEEGLLEAGEMRVAGGGRRAGRGSHG